ncbi:MAG: 6-carboxytetrahydropterin synthase [Candidatus Kapaibacterium sp.]|nr:MAG: 6-carboxytetrahydropterin synthase [Candidatus Kapabacteria bacterium]
MNTRIAKEFHWEMAHRLPFHTGGCQNVHGHSYKLWVELEGETDTNGMVLDYLDLKRAVAPLVDALDHSFLCDRADSVMVRFFAEHPLKAVMVDFPTTAENIAAYLLGEITSRLQEQCSREAWMRLRSIRVRVQETERTFAEVACLISEA